MKQFDDVNLNGVSDEGLEAGKKFIGEIVFSNGAIPLTQEGCDVLRLRARESIDEVVKHMVNQFITERGV